LFAGDSRFAFQILISYPFLPAWSPLPPAQNWQETRSRQKIGGSVDFMKFVISTLTPPAKFRPKRHREVSRRMKLCITSLHNYATPCIIGVFAFAGLELHNIASHTAKIMSLHKVCRLPLHDKKEQNGLYF